MSIRKQILATNEIYHVLNRGVASTDIFESSRDYQRFIDLMNFYKFSNPKVSYSSFMNLNRDLKHEFWKKLESESDRNIEIFAYCLMPNHFHILLRQLVDNGIKITMAKAQNAYAKYINLKNKRHGPLFQSRFKAVRIENDETLLHVSRYIHLNPATSYLIEPTHLTEYEWSTYGEYISPNKLSGVNVGFVLDLCGGSDNYKKFVLDQADYQRSLGLARRLVLE